MASTATPDWQRLDPFRQLDGGDPGYVERPPPFGFDIAGALLAGLGGGRLLVNGPAGVGKSTELATAAHRLRAKARRALHLSLDTTFDMRQLDELTLLTAILSEADRLLDGDALAEGTLGALLAALVLNPAIGAAFFVGRQILRDISKPPGDATPTLAEALDGTGHALKKAGGGQGLDLLLDGFEKAPADRVGPALDLLVELADRAGCRVVVVASPSAVAGEAGRRAVERYKPIECAPVDPETPAGLDFLRAIFTRRLGLALDDLDPSTRGVIDRAARLSGGLPRTFLRLLLDAAGYAGLRGRPAPDADALDEAFADQVDSQRMLLEHGDLEHMKRVEADGGRTLPGDVRARHLAHGTLLVRGTRREKRLALHPVMRALLADDAGS